MSAYEASSSPDAPPENSFYFDIEEYEIPEPVVEPLVVETPVAESAKNEAEPEKEPEEPKVEGPPPVVDAKPDTEPEKAPEEPKPKKAKKKEPLKPEVPLAKDEVDNVLSKLPDAMNAALAESQEEGKYEFRGSSDMKPPSGSSVARKVFPPLPPTPEELKAEKLAREAKEAQKAASHALTLAPVVDLEKTNARKTLLESPASPPAAPSKEDKDAAKAAQKAAEAAQKAADQKAKEDAKEAERAAKAAKEAEKAAEKAQKEAEKARQQAEALAAQEKLEREIFKVENYSPEGFLDSKTLKRIVITFNHPLDVKTTNKDNPFEPVWAPKVTPALPPGKWTVDLEADNDKALIFTPADETAWPLSTVYTVKIVAGNMGKDNRPLAKELVFHFTTPTLKLTAMYPKPDAQDVNPNAPLIFVFDQPVDTKLLLAHKKPQLVVFDNQGKEIDMESSSELERLAILEEEHKVGNAYTSLISKNEDCHWIALHPKSPLPRYSRLHVHMDTGLTSLLGPAPSREPALDQYFNTRAPFLVTSTVMPSSADRSFDTLQINFNTVLCGPKQTIDDIKWRPTILPAPPQGTWILHADRNALSYRTDAPLKFGASMEYIVTIEHDAKSYFSQALERNNNLHFWSSGEQPLPQLGVNKKTHAPAQPFWYSAVTNLNRIATLSPRDGMIASYTVWFLETDQPLDEAEFIKNANFYVQATGVVGGLKSLVTKEKPFGKVKFVPLDDASRSWREISWESYWRRIWYPNNHFYAFTCTDAFPPEHHVTLRLGPELPSLLGPVAAQISQEYTFETPAASKMLAPRFQPIKSRPDLGELCPAVKKQIERVRRVDPYIVHEVWANQVTSNVDDFKPTCTAPSELIPDHPVVSRREKLGVVWAKYLSDKDARAQAYQTALTTHEQNVKAQDTLKKQYEQQLLQNIAATRTALSQRQALPAPVPPLQLQYIPPAPPPVDSPRLSEDLPDPTVDDLVTPFQPVHALVVSFTTRIALAPRVALDWTPVITPAPPAGHWFISSDQYKYVYVPTAAWNMATKYTVSLPANARSAFGQPIVLPDPAKTDVTVDTPSARVDEYWAFGASKTDVTVKPKFVIAFTQKVKGKKLLKHVEFSVTHENNEALKKPRKIAARLVPDDVFKQHKESAEYVKRYAEGKYIVVEPVSPLPYHSHVILSVSAEFPSAEGPLTASPASEHGFETAPTFEVTSFAPKHALGSQEKLFVRFNQPLLKLDKELVDTDYTLPWTPVLTPTHPGSWLLQRDTTGKFVSNALKFVPTQPWPRATEFTISLAAGTKSLVGETLQADWSVKVSTPAAEFVRVWPADHSLVARYPRIFLEFDTPVHGKDVVKCCKLSAAGAQVPLALVSTSDALQIPAIARLANACEAKAIAALAGGDSAPSTAQTSSTTAPSTSTTDTATPSDAAPSKAQDTPIVDVSHGGAITEAIKEATIAEATEPSEKKSKTKKDKAEGEKKDKTDADNKKEKQPAEKTKPRKPKAEIDPSQEPEAEAPAAKAKPSKKPKEDKSEKPSYWVVITTANALTYHANVSLTLTNLKSAYGNVSSNASYAVKFTAVGPLECELVSPVAYRQELPTSELRLAIQFNQPIVDTPNAILSSEIGARPSQSQASSAESSNADAALALPVPPFEPILEMAPASSKTPKRHEVRWIVEDDGKRIISAEPVSLALSSRYFLKVPTPVMSLYNESLQDSITYMLSTPTNRLAESWPRPGGVIRETSQNPPVLLRFSQPFDQAEMLSRIQFYVKKEKSKSLLSGLFSKKDDKKPFCGAVLVKPEDLGVADGKILALIKEWDKLAFAQESIVQEQEVIERLPPTSPKSKSKSKRKHEEAEEAKPEEASAPPKPRSVYSSAHWILVRPERPLPHSSRINVVLGPNLPSTLGPFRSAERRLKLFLRTAPPLEVHHWVHSDGQALYLYFNQNMFHNGVRLLTTEELTWKPQVDVEFPTSSYARWSIESPSLMKFWARQWANSTTYVFSILANTATSMYGQTLAETAEWKIEKPHLSIVDHSPFSYLTCDPVIYFKFSQHVDPKEIAAHCKVYAKDNKSVTYTTLEPVRFQDALASVKSASLYRDNNYGVISPDRLIEFRRGASGRVAYFRFKNPLMPGTKYVLQMGPGLPSLEGPIVTPKPLKYDFRTVVSFNIVETSKNITTTRLSPFYIYFSNHIASGLVRTQDPSLKARLLGSVSVTPAALIENVECSYDYVTVWMRTDSLSEKKIYKVTLSNFITDNFGQSLSEEITDDAAALEARSVNLTVHPKWFQHELVHDMTVDGQKQLFYTLDPLLVHHHGLKPSFRLQNINYQKLRVILYKLNPKKDLPAWIKLHEEYESYDDKHPLPDGLGEVVSDTIINVSEFKDPLLFGTQAAVDIDLTPALKNQEKKLGHIGLVVVPPEASHAPNNDERPFIRAWIQCTRLGIEGFQSSQGLFAWVHDLVDSKPLSGVALSTVPARTLSKDELKAYHELPSAKTDDLGWATLEAPHDDYYRHLLARSGDDVCILRDVSLYSSFSANRIFAHIWNDRGIYRPKETVEIKGYLRELFLSDKGVPAYRIPALEEGAKADDYLKNMKWTLLDPQGAKVSEGSFVPNSVFGTFHITVLLPETINLGTCSVVFTGYGPTDKDPAVPALDATHQFEVQEFRRPDFVAKSEILDPRTSYMYGEDVLVKVEASYFAGGALPECDVTWKVSSTKAGFSAPGWLGYLFTTAKDRVELANSLRMTRALYEYTKNFAALTDDKGRSAVKILFKGKPNIVEPVNVVVDIEVLDLNKQALTSQQKLLVHPSRLYLGVKLPDGDTLKGDIGAPGGPNGKPLSVMLVLSDIDGKLVPDLPIKVEVYNVLAANPNKLQTVLTSTLVPSRAPVPAVYEFDRTKFKKTPPHEHYALVVSHTDKVTGLTSEVVVLLNDQTGTAHKFGAPVVSVPTITPHIPSMRPPHSHIETTSFSMEDKKTNEIVRTKYETLPVEILKLELTQKEYRVGEMVGLKITTALPLPAEAIVVIHSHTGATIASTQTIVLKDELTLVEFSLMEHHAPWTTVYVAAIATIVRAGVQEDMEVRRLAQAEGSIDIPVVANHLELQVEVMPADTDVAPGTETEVTVNVKDWKANAVDRAEVALVVVDESVLSMTHYEIPSIHKFFYDHEKLKAYIPKLAKYSLRKGIPLKDLAAVLTDLKKHEEQQKALEAQLEEIVDDVLVPGVKKDLLEDDTINEAKKELEGDPAVVDSADEDDEEPKEELLGDKFDAVGGRGARSKLASREQGEERSRSSRNASDGGGLFRKSEMQLSPKSNSAPPPRQAVSGGAYPSSPRMDSSSSFGGPPPPPPAAQAAPPPMMASSSMSFASPPPPSPSALGATLSLRKASLDDSESDGDDGAVLNADDDWDEEEAPVVEKRMKLSMDLEAEEMPKRRSKEKEKKESMKDMKKIDKNMKPAPMKSKKKNMASRPSAMAAPSMASMSHSVWASEEMKEEEMMDAMPAVADLDEQEHEAESSEEEAEEIFLRSNFNPLAHFSDAVLVNDQGVAKIIVKLPDNLTRYRIWAVAVSAKRSKFGMGEALITASLPLQVRITPPRFLNYGDDAELPIVIQNTRERPIEVKVAVRAIRAILGVARAVSSESQDSPTPVDTSDYDAFISPDLTTTGFLVEVPANGRRMITVPIKATKAGVCRFQVSVLQGLFGDAQEVRVNVLAPPTANSFTLAGSLGGGKLPGAICTDLRVPSDALPEFGSLEISLSTTKLQALSEPALFLAYIPYDYTEQRASRVMALASMAPILEAFAAKSKGRYPDAAYIKSTVSSDMHYFKNSQLADGTYRMWGPPEAASAPPPAPGQDRAAAFALSRAWLTAQVAQAVGAARAAGFPTHEPLLSIFTTSWTKKLEKALVVLCERSLHSKDDGFAGWAAAKCYTIYAYAHLTKDYKQAAKYAETFYKGTSPQTLSVESLGFLLSVFAEVKHDFAAQVVNYLETTVQVYDLETRVSYPDVYSDEARYELFHSRTRTDAVLLEAIVSAKPDSKLVGHLFRGLMRARTDSKWNNTQDNAFAIVAVYKYFKVFEATEPDLKARIWLDKDACIEETFVGRTTDTRVTEIPMSYVLKNPEEQAKKIEEEKAVASPKKDEHPVVVEESSDAGDDEDVDDPRTRGNADEPLQGKALLIHKSGKGRLYYTLKINYAPKTLNVPATDYGFAVSRAYASPTYVENMQGTADILWLNEQAMWRVRKGVKVRVEMKLVVYFPTTFVALVDRLPAGFEPIAIDEHPTREKVLPPAINVAEGAEDAAKKEDAPAWWAHVNLRDSRVEVLADQLVPGTYLFSYIARATIAGHYLVPPARAEELYQPSVQGNTSSSRLVIV